MDYQTIREARLRDPFRPFMLKTVEGRAIRVEDPLQLAVVSHSVLVVDPDTEESVELKPSEVESISYMDITCGGPRMAKAREMMTKWVVEALQKLGGRGTILEINRCVWERHEQDIRAAADLLYEWQYELRWSGDILRRDGVLRPARDVSKGIWELT